MVKEAHVTVYFQPLSTCCGPLLVAIVWIKKECGEGTMWNVETSQSPKDKYHMFL